MGLHCAKLPQENYRISNNRIEQAMRFHQQPVTAGFGLASEIWATGGPNVSTSQTSGTLNEKEKVQRDAAENRDLECAVVT